MADKARAEHGRRAAKQQAQVQGDWRYGQMAEPTAAERPAWMADPGLLPKRPPGRRVAR